MKRIYSLLPPAVAKRVRGVLEFDGGVTDTYLLAAQANIGRFDVITQGTAKAYRPAPGCVGRGPRSGSGRAPPALF